MPFVGLVLFELQALSPVYAFLDFVRDGLLLFVLLFVVAVQMSLVSETSDSKESEESVLL